ncbi:MAG: KTSC domain-containing protein [Bacteroidota bacterium]|nr:KTSC domain-containing protein [Bacteroidota bacterium]
MNYFQLTVYGLRLTWYGYKQLAFIRSFLKPLVEKHCRRLDYILSSSEKKKVLFYYPMYTVLACAQMYLTLKGRKLTNYERQRLTLVGSMATLCDDLIDENNFTREQIFNLLSNNFNHNEFNTKAKLLVALNKELQKLYTFSPAYLQQLKMALQRQAASVKQSDATISLQEIVNICREKNGHTSLMFASLLDENWSNEELQFIYQSAIVGQLTNDSFDIYFDTQQGIKTYFNSASIKKGREFFIDECTTLHTMVMACDVPMKNKLRTIQRMSILHAFTLTALDHLQETENKYGAPVDWKNIPRKEMITDMWKNKNRVKTVRYMKYLSNIIPNKLTMKREPVESTAIKSIGYNEDKQILEVEILETGRVYKYFNVPLEEYIDFLEAKSLGEYYNRVIKENYEYRELA